MEQRENKAAWVAEPKGHFKPGPAEYSDPGSTEVVIKVSHTFPMKG
jgi:hypothetical protein